MFGSEAVNCVVIDVTVDPTADKVYPVLRAARALTIQRLTAQTSIAHGAGTAYALSLLNYGTGGTAVKATGGTISASVGGTAAPMAANTPATTATMSNGYVAEGEYVVLNLDEQGAGWQSGEILRVQVDYVWGKG